MPVAELNTTRPEHDVAVGLGVYGAGAGVVWKSTGVGVMGVGDCVAAPDGVAVSSEVEYVSRKP